MDADVPQCEAVGGLSHRRVRTCFAAGRSSALPLTHDCRHDWKLLANFVEKHREQFYGPKINKSARDNLILTRWNCAKQFEATYASKFDPRCNRPIVFQRNWPQANGEFTPWMQMFRNARQWIG